MPGRLVMRMGLSARSGGPALMFEERLSPSKQFGGQIAASDFNNSFSSSLS